MLIYRRPNLTAAVFEAVRAVRPSKLLVVADGPRPGEELLCEETRAIFHRVDWDCEVLTHFALRNMGLRERVSSGLTWVFEKVETAIILEDDCLPHPTFFRYCAELLELYRDTQEVMVISGDNAHGFRSRDINYYFTKYALIWGWGTWRRAWELYDNTMADWPKRKTEGWLSEILSNPHAVRHWEQKFQGAWEGFNSWARVWMYACWRNNGLCATPGVNLISNIGFGREATHTKGNIDSRANIQTQAMRFPLEHPEIKPLSSADQFIERSMFSGREKSRNANLSNYYQAVRALETGNPWRAYALFEAMEEGGLAVASLGKTAALCQLGQWDGAGVVIGSLDDSAFICDLKFLREQINTEGDQATRASKPLLPDRIQFVQSLELTSHRNHSLVRLGGTGSSNYGAWVVAGDMLDEHSVCYLTGAGEDITFDCAVSERFGCEVHIFDPTPRAISHYEEFVKHMNGTVFCPDLYRKYESFSRAAMDRLVFHHVGLAARPGLLRFYVPRNPAHVSHSIANLQHTDDYFEAECVNLTDMMERLGHDRIDLLKIDIEGAEYEVIESFLDRDVQIRMLCVEFDEGHNPLDKSYQRRIQACANLLKKGGYQPVFVEDWNVLFLKIDASLNR
jgi:FkbM family methyltransferase